LPYVPHTPADRERMLARLGVGSVDELFAEIPAEIIDPEIRLPGPLGEPALLRRAEELAAANAPRAADASFIGAGAYDHLVPAAAAELIRRAEFYTAYTPYQPEMSQGLLQSIYEYQTMVASLTGMDVANASLYDGGTALYEAALMAVRITRGKKRRVVASADMNPFRLEVLRSYCRAVEVELVEVPFDVETGAPDAESLAGALDDGTAGLLVQDPNFFGVVSDVSGLAEAAHAKEAVLVIDAYPVALSVLRSPGSMGADIVCGEAQSLGLELNFGGPYLGYLAARKEFVRQMPGRIAGATADTQDRRGFVLTLQTREQHIRREKATSNICSNQALCALQACMTLTLYGKRGFRELGQRILAACEYTRAALGTLKGCSLPHAGPHFNEFVLMTPRPATEVLAGLAGAGICGGYALGPSFPRMENDILVAVTEKSTRNGVDRYAEVLEGLL